MDGEDVKETVEQEKDEMDDQEEDNDNDRSYDRLRRASRVIVPLYMMFIHT